METRHLIFCSLLSGLTPVMVLLNAISMSASAITVQSWKPVAAIAHANLRQLDDWDAPSINTQLSVGGARIIETSTGYVLEFHNSFTRMEQTLDLELVLSRSAVPSQQALLERRELHVGPLQWAAGMQRYELPTEIAVGQYQSVVIWCQDLKMIVGYANLET